MEFLDIVRLDLGHNLVIGNLPNHFAMQPLLKKQVEEKKSVEKFGLWDTAAPNLVTYYPGLDPKDLDPNKDKEGFVYPIYRALSEVIVHKSINPVDFSEPGVLKASMPLLVGQTLYVNHEAMVGNEVGVIVDAEWQEEYKTEDGIRVPAGINTRHKVDGKAHPSIARGIMMDPPSIHSTSVTVEFAWKPSHPQMSQDEFRTKLGTFDEKGVLIRRVVTKIKRYAELSYVTHGADPFAQKVKQNGQITNPIYADIAYNSGDGKKEQQVYAFSYKQNLISLSAKPDKPKKEDTMELTALLAVLATITGVEQEKLVLNDVKATLEKFKADAAALTAAQSQVTTLTAEVTQLKTDKTTLEAAKATLEGEKTALTAAKTTAEQSLATANTTITELKGKQVTDTQLAMVKVGEECLAETRKETLRLFKLVNPAGDANVEKLIADADINTLKFFATQYSRLCDEKFPGKCNACGSSNVSRQSAITPTGTLVPLGAVKPTETGFSIEEKLEAGKRKKSTNVLFPTDEK